VKAAILDTDILSYVLNRKHPEVDATARQYLRVFRYFSVSTITLAESIQGIVNKPRRSQEL
jgi:predicted nucleic acid-binding protein